MTQALFERHHALLLQAAAAAQSRRHWNPYADGLPAAAADAEQAHEWLERQRNTQFYLDQPGVIGRMGNERSPYGAHLGVRYPECAPDALLAAARNAMPGWVRAGTQARIGVCMEVLARLHAAADELVFAVMHATGQAHGIALHVGVTQALARGLECVVMAWREMNGVAPRATWSRSGHGGEPLHVDKEYSIVPRGQALVIGSASAPTWEAMPPIFASLATGNAVLVRPPRSAILPLALVVATCRQVLWEAGFDGNLISLAGGEHVDPALREAARTGMVRLVDHAGGDDDSHWETASATTVFDARMSPGCAVVDSTDDYAGMIRYLTVAIAFDSAALPFSLQNIFVPGLGLTTPDGRISAESFRRDLAQGIGRLVEDPRIAAGVLRSVDRHESAAADAAAEQVADVLRPAQYIAHPRWPEASLRVPPLLRCESSAKDVYGSRLTTPAILLVDAQTTMAALAAAEEAMAARASHELLVYSTNPHVVQAAEEVAMRVGAMLSVNLCTSLNQASHLAVPAAFSDLAGGGDAAGRTTLVDDRYVNNRFAVVERRQMHAGDGV